MSFAVTAEKLRLALKGCADVVRIDDDGNEEREDESQFLRPDTQHLECYLECVWGKCERGEEQGDEEIVVENGLETESWKGVSMSWRNTHPRVDADPVDEKERDPVDYDGESKTREGKQEEGEQEKDQVFESSRFWFKERIQFTDLSAENLSKFLRCGGVVLRVREGKKASDDSRILGEAVIPTHPFFQSRHLHETVRFIPTAGLGIRTIDVDLSLYPSEEFFEAVSGGYVFGMDKLEILSIPEAFVAPLVDTVTNIEEADTPNDDVEEQDNEAKSNDGFTVEQVEQITQMLEENPIELKVTVRVPCKGRVKPVEEKEAEDEEEGDRAESKESVNEESEGKTQDAQEEASISFSQGGFLVSFDHDSQTWRALAPKTKQENNASFLYTSNAHSWDDIKISILKEGEEGEESCVSEETVCAILEPGRTLYPLSSQNVDVEFEVEPAFVKADASILTYNGEVGSVAQTVRVSQSQHEDTKNILHQSAAKSKLFEEIKSLQEPSSLLNRRLVEKIRILLIRSLQEDKLLQEQILQQGKDGIDVLKAASQLFVHFAKEDDSDGLDEVMDRLVDNALDAETMGHVSRAQDIWQKCLVVEDSHHEAILGYAKFSMRKGDLWKALQLLAPFSDGAFIDVVEHLAKQDQVNSPRILHGMCAYELGGLEDAGITFNTVGSPSARLATKLRNMGRLALDLSLPNCALAALIAANEADPAPLVDDMYVENEILRTRFKMLQGNWRAARAIIEAALKDNENASAKSVSCVVRARAQFFLGSVLEKIPDEAPRASYTAALATISELSDDAPNAVAEAARALRLQITQRLGTLCLEAEDFRRARAAFRNATRLANDTCFLGWAWLGLGEACIMLSDMQSADAALKQAVIVDSCNPEAWALISSLQLRCCNVKEALAAGQLALDNGLEQPSHLRRIVQDIEAARSQYTETPASMAVLDELHQVISARLELLL